MDFNNVALTFAKNVGWNSLVGSGHYFAGFVVAKAVSTIACMILKPKEGSNHDTYIKFFAAIAGIAFTLHYAPQTALVSFTADQTLKLIAGSAIYGFFVSKITTISSSWQLITVGAMAGYFGSPALTAFAGAGAAVGAKLFTNGAVETPTRRNNASSTSFG